MDYNKPLMGETAKAPTETRNVTRSDAFERVQMARMGSLDRPTTEYLLALRSLVLEWEEEIAAEIRRDYKPR